MVIFFSVKKNNFYTKILNIKNKKLNQRKLINFNKEYTKKFDLELATTKLIREYKKLIF